VSWHAVDADGFDLATGRPPAGRGWRTPAAALAGAPVAAWPLRVVHEDGRHLPVGEALGPGGDRVERLLEALAAEPNGLEVATLAQTTPVGTVDLPVAVLALPDAVEASALVDPAWLASVDRARAAPRQALLAAGRDQEVEAALHLTLLLATERLDPADDADVDAHIASGAQLWLLAGAVVSALAGAAPDPFWAWARLVVAGWWPVGPSGDHLVVAATEHAR
jgi:hypothetical protein